MDSCLGTHSWLLKRHKKTSESSHEAWSDGKIQWAPETNPTKLKTWVFKGQAGGKLQDVQLHSIWQKNLATSNYSWSWNYLYNRTWPIHHNPSLPISGAHMFQLHQVKLQWDLQQPQLLLVAQPQPIRPHQLLPHARVTSRGLQATGEKSDWCSHTTGTWWL